MKNFIQKDGYTYIAAPRCINDDDDNDFIDYIQNRYSYKRDIGFLEKGLKIRHSDCFGFFTHITTIDDPSFIKKHNKWLIF